MAAVSPGGRRRRSAAARLRSVPVRAARAWRGRGKPPLHLLRPGKTGGTAVGHVLTSRPLRHYALVPHTHRDTMAAIAPGEQVLFVVREPASRFVSGFNSRLRKGGTVHPKEWSEAEREVFERFTTPDSLACALVSGDASERAAAEAAMAAVSHLRRHQVHWVVDLATLRERRADVLFVGRQWALDEDFARLVDLVGLEPGTTLPRGEIAHRTPAGMSTSLSDRGREAVLSWYRDDVEFLAELERLGPEVGFGGFR